MSPALYKNAATATQYPIRQQRARKGTSGQKRSVGMVATAWLATLMHATATCPDQVLSAVQVLVGILV